MNIIEVKWIDSSYTIGWQTFDYWDENCLKYCHSIGFEIKRTKNYIVIANSISIDPVQANGVMIIPIRNITFEKYWIKKQ